jgi:hypothetical protein
MFSRRKSDVRWKEFAAFLVGRATERVQLCGYGVMIGEGDPPDFAAALMKNEDLLLAHGKHFIYKQA